VGGRPPLLVVSEPRRDTFATRLAREDALDLSYSRALLESFAARTLQSALKEVSNDLIKFLWAFHVWQVCCR